jgi:hypothetical protein
LAIFIESSKVAVRSQVKPQAVCRTARTPEGKAAAMLPQMPCAGQSSDNAMRQEQ